MKPFVIFGTGDFSDIIYDLITKDMNREVGCFCVDDPYYEKGVKYKGHEVLPFSALPGEYPPDAFVSALGLIGKEMFIPRSSCYKKLSSLGYTMENIYAKGIELPASIGSGNIVLQNVSFGYGVKIGDGNIIWQGAVFPHHNTVGDFNNFAPGFSMSGYSAVRSHCFLGNNATVKNRVCINDFTLVGAGAYVDRDTEEYEVIVPSRSYTLKGKRSVDLF